MLSLILSLLVLSPPFWGVSHTHKPLGSIRHDIPISGLAEMLNCQFFIASQCNPHIVPFFFNPKGGVGRPSRWSSGEQEHSWRGGFLLAALEMYLKVRLVWFFWFGSFGLGTQTETYNL